MFKKTSLKSLSFSYLQKRFITETYRISAKGPSTGGVTWTHENTHENFELKQALDTLLATLASCQNRTANYHAKQMQLPIKNISFDIEADYDARLFLQVLETPNRFSQIRVKAEVETDGTQENVDKLRELVEQHSPIEKMMRKAGVDFINTWIKKE